MKKIIAVTAMLMVATVGLRGADNVDITLDATYASKYLFRGVLLGDQSFQPSVEVSMSDFYAGIWSNQALDKRATYADNEEYDFYVGKNFTVTDIASLDVGYTYYYYPKVHSDNGTSEGYVGVNWDVSGFSPSVYAYYDFTLEAFTLQGSVGTSIPLTGTGTSLDLTATLGHVDVSGGNYNYWSLGASVPFKLSDKSTLTLGAIFATNDIDGADDNNVAGTVSYTFAF